MAGESVLVTLAKDAEDVASGFTAFRERVPSDVTRITAAVSELYAVSSLLRALDHATRHPRLRPALALIRNEVGILIVSLQRTVDATLDAFGQTRFTSYRRAWADLCILFEEREGLGLLARLELYQDVLRAFMDVLQGQPPPTYQDIKTALGQLFRQQSGGHPARPPANRAATAPQRPYSRGMDSPASPLSTSTETWSYHSARPPAPEPPTPLSPTFTSDSSHTLESSETSYSANVPPPDDAVEHWAQEIFDGEHPASQFRPQFQSAERSVCQGPADSHALQRISNDGFVRALQVPFDGAQLWLRLYFRPADRRSRILIQAKDAHNRDCFYSTHTTNLKVIRGTTTDGRKGSCLLLCRSLDNGRYSQWARLNFRFYERMVLFYSAFVGMKAQDTRPLPHPSLLDNHELDEHEVFAGKIYATAPPCENKHALRLWKDRASGVVRLEACPLRGPKKHVPIWTAFVTRYADDQDWAHYERNGMVNLAAIRPHPYVFCPGYQLPRARHDAYLLHFTTDSDAKYFVENWTRICNGGS